MMEYYVMEKQDYARIKKLRTLHNIDTIYEDAKRFTSRVRSDHSLSRLAILIEARRGELMQAKRAFYED